MRKYVFTAILCLLISSTYAQVKKASVKDLAFMSGTWVQKSSWGELEEYWSSPQGDNMISSFRCLQDGKAVFYEFVVIELEGDLPVMKMRHFNKGSIAWESKEDPLQFHLIALAGNTATFYCKEKDVKLTYTLSSQNKLDVILEETDTKGKRKQDIFNFSRK